MNDEEQYKEAFKSYKHNLILQASHNGECIWKQMPPFFVEGLWLSVERENMHISTFRKPMPMVF